ncbi:hypothetical protein SAMN05216377_1119 [Pseudonocardia oroxyli]|uniref:Uncharacterized protein n=1 Tax=Pseudonocardia oroxyli TaxID=366584 RepID=A0A1G7TFE8_PSEOR|nr:hypothetical protein SAMN05216377_1119 [Pseudonocardia oroxyli]
MRVRFTAAERDLIRAAAAAAGVTAATWIGELVTATLRGDTPEATGELRELLTARAAVVELAGRTTGGELVSLAEAVSACRRIDKAAAALMDGLRRPR